MGEITRGACPYRFTVFTPTYNRAHTLHRVFDSLMKQTFSDFEWLVVDDGSTDGTEAVLKQFAEQTRWPMRTVNQPNLGKPAAFNRAVREAKGFLFLTLDSDDACKPRALERFDYYWESIPFQERGGFSGVTVLCEDQDGRPVGDRFPTDIFDSDSLRNRYVHRIRGEKWGCHRTEVLRMFPFDETRGVSLSTVWNRIARRYRTRYVNEALRIYYTNESHGSLTQETHSRIAGPQGKALTRLEVLNRELDYFWYAPQNFILSFIHYGRFSLLNRTPVSQIVRDLDGTWRRLAMVSLLPISYVVAMRDRIGGRVLQ